MPERAAGHATVNDSAGPRALGHGMKTQPHRPCISGARRWQFPLLPRNDYSVLDTGPDESCNFGLCSSSSLRMGPAMDE